MIATGSRSKVGFIPEVTFGTIPATPNLTEVPFTSFFFRMWLSLKEISTYLLAVGDPKNDDLDGVYFDTFCERIGLLGVADSRYSKGESYLPSKNAKKKSRLLKGGEGESGSNY